MSYIFIGWRKAITELVIFAMLSLAALAIATLVGGSIFSDVSWSVFIWLFLGTVIAWILLVMPCCLMAEASGEPARIDYERLRLGVRRGINIGDITRDVPFFVRESGLVTYQINRDYRNRVMERLAAAKEKIDQLDDIQAEIFLVGFLISLAGAAYLVSYLSTHEILEQQRFAPTETAQVITATSGLAVAIGTSIAAIMKAYALLLRARADVIRARKEKDPVLEELEDIEDHGRLRT